MRALPPRIGIALIAGAMLLGACSSGSDPAAAGDAAPSPNGSPVQQEATDEPTPSPGTPTPDASQHGEETPAPDPPPVGHASEATPPAPGLYRYRQEGTGIFEKEIPEEGTLRVHPATIAGNGQRQRHERVLASNQSTEQVLLFRANVVLLEEATQTYGSGRLAHSFRCRFDPALRVARVPAEVGASWSSSSTCDRTEVDFSAEYLREQTITIAGARVQTAVLRIRIEMRDERFRQKVVTTSWISPMHRLIVRSHQTSEGSMGSSEFHEEILNLEPE